MTLSVTKVTSKVIETREIENFKIMILYKFSYAHVQPSCSNNHQSFSRVTSLESIIVIYQPVLSTERRSSLTRGVHVKEFWPFSCHADQLRVDRDGD